MTGSYAVTGPTNVGSVINFTGTIANNTGAWTVPAFGVANFSTTNTVTINSLTLTGTVAGTAALNIGNLNWIFGAICGTSWNVGVATCGSTSVLEPPVTVNTIVTAGATHIALGGRPLYLNSFGTASFSGSTLVLYSGATVNNGIGATWADANISDDGTGTFNNTGTFETATASVDVSTAFLNAGAVTAARGTRLNIGDVETSGGSWTANAAATLDLVCAAASPTTDLSGVFTAVAGTPGGSLMVGGPCVLGTFNVNSGGTATLNPNTETWSSRRPASRRSTNALRRLDNNPAPTTTVTGTYNAAGATFITGGTVNFTGTVQNAGALTISGGATVDFATGSPVTISSVNLVSGTLGGTDPVTVSGTYTQGSNAMSVTISGTGAGQVNTINDSTGSAALTGGALNVTLANGFVPAAGNSFTVLTAASLSGQFASTNLPTLPGDLQWQVNYNTNSTPNAVVLSVVTVAGPAASIAVATGTTPQSATVGAAFTANLAAVVTDSYGTPVSGVTVSFSAPASGPGGMFPGGVNTAVTDSTGTATAPALTANTQAGSYVVQASATGVPGTAIFSLINLPGAPAAVVATSGANQSASITAQFANPLQATVNDAYGNAVSSGIIVVFAAPGSGAGGTFAGSGNSSTASTSASGIATAPAFTANTYAGQYSVYATVQGAGFPPASFPLANLAGAPNAITATAGTPQSATVNTPFGVTLQATVQDLDGNPVQNASVTFTAPAGGPTGTFAGGGSAFTGTTNGSGVVAAPLFTAGVVAGPYQVTAVSGSFSATFNLTNTAGEPALITATGGTPQSAQIGTTFGAALQASVTDSFGNPVAGVPVSFSALSGGMFAGGTTSATANTNPSGMAAAPAFTAGTSAGSDNVTATVAGVGSSASFSLTNTPGAPGSVSAVVGGTPQATVVSTVFPNQLQAVVKDVDGNAVPFATVTFTVVPAPGGAGGTFANGLATISTPTDTTGTAMAGTFTANAIAGGYAVTASAAGASSATFNLTNTAGPPNAIAATAGTPQSATVDSVFATLLVATVADAAGNPVPGVTVTFTAPGSGPGGSFAGGVNTATTNAQGQATALAFTANGIAGPYTVTASVAGVATTAAFSLTNTAPALQSIAVTPASPSVAKGTMQQFTATGTYSDSTTQNLTSQVTWNSSATAVATITAGGLATGTGAGTSTIRAALGPVSGSTLLTVTESLTPVTLQTSPAGLLITVDGGAAQAAPFTVNLAAGVHTIGVASTQPGTTGTEYVFTGWSDGGAASHSITVTAAVTLTASFQTEYQISGSVSPAGGGTVSVDPHGHTSAWVIAGGITTVTARPAANYSFSGFAGDATGTVTGTTTPLVVTATAPVTFTADFTAVP